jgi:hypothetical protein
MPTDGPETGLPGSEVSDKPVDNIASEKKQPAVTAPDQTPTPTAAYIPVEDSRATGTHCIVDMHPIHGPSRLARVAALAAITAAMSIGLSKKGPKTPRPPQVIDGNDGTSGKKKSSETITESEDGHPFLVIPEPQNKRAHAGTGDGQDAGDELLQAEDLCGRETFAADRTPEETAAPGESVCQFITEEDGSMRIVGHTLIDEEGKPRDCFVNPVWAPDSALKIRGGISGAFNDKGKIFLDKGKLCVTMLHQNNPEFAESLVIGEASLHIITTDKVIVKMLDPELDNQSGRMMHYAAIYPVKGDVLITQDGRDEQIRLSEGDSPVKIPLYIERTDAGCHVAVAPGEPMPDDSGGELMLTAAAVFLILRRREKKSN